MALQVKVENPFGVDASKGYAKIVNIRLAKGAMLVDVGFFASIEARKVGGQPLTVKTYHYSRNVDALVAEAYDFLKTQDDFKQAESV